MHIVSPRSHGVDEQAGANCALTQQLPEPQSSSALQRAPIEPAIARSWQTVATTVWKSCAIEAGKLYCFGDNADGTLGHTLGLVPGYVLSSADDE